MGPGAVYTMFQFEGRNVAAGYSLDPQARSQGVSPHWMLYIASASADASAAKIAQSGGQVAASPFDVMEYGRMAVCKDPAGAHFSIWQPKMHPGLGVTNQAGAFCWADLSVPNPDAVTDFYKKVFDWEISAGQDKSGYLHIKNGEQFIGGIPPSSHRNPNEPPHWLIYIMTNDCDNTTATAVGLGGRTLAGPMTLEGVGRIAVISDPQGAIFALYQPPTHH
jgi:predicted enzyme related to lactoylglutathione lyase